MPMETARGIIQIESGKNYYWRASRGRAGSFRGRICEYEEEKRSCRSQVEVGGGGGGGGGRISRRGEGERKSVVVVMVVAFEVVQVEGTTSPSRPRRMIHCSIAR